MRIVEQLPFFKDKNSDFQFRVLPLLKVRKLYAGDVFYSEGDLAEEIVFVLSGTFYLYKDISDMIQLPPKLIDKETLAFNVPFLRYGTGSYFGDEDCIFQIDQEGSPDLKKFYRESTAECVDDAEIMIIKRRQLVDELHKFIAIKDYMIAIAKEKKKYHKVLINSILNRYKNPAEGSKLIEQRMKDYQITTHMSLKQALKKNKDLSRAISSGRKALKKEAAESAVHEE